MMKTFLNIHRLLYFVVFVIPFRPLMPEEGIPNTPAMVEPDDLTKVAKRLQLKGEKKAHFRELRYFPFRFEPVRLDGVIRISKEWGTSIDYPDKCKMVIMDQDGILLRRERKNGAIEEKEMPVEDSGTASLFAALFEFNTDFLKENFSLHWAKTVSGWKLDLIPANSTDWKVERIFVAGQCDQILGIEVDFGQGRRIKIQPGEECESEDLFGAHEREKYFRRP